MSEFRRRSDKISLGLIITLGVHLVVAIYQYGRMNATLEQLVLRVARIEVKQDRLDARPSVRGGQLDD